MRGFSAAPGARARKDVRKQRNALAQADIVNGSAECPILLVHAVTLCVMAQRSRAGRPCALRGSWFVGFGFVRSG